MILAATPEALMPYLASRLPYPPEHGGPGAFVAADNGLVKAAWMFEPSIRGAVELHVAADDPRWAMRGNLQAMFEQAFYILGAKRIMTGVGESNTRSFRLAKWAGFKVAGFLPNWYRPGEGCVIFDMEREDCVWIGENFGRPFEEDN